MTAQDPNHQFSDEYRPIDGLADIPECRVLATVDPAGLIRFEVTEQYARHMYEQVEQSLGRYDGDGLLDLTFPCDGPGMASLTKGLAQLLSAPEIAAKQVRPEHVESPDIAISVAVNESQLESSAKKNYAAIKQYGLNQQYGHRFGISKNGAVILLQQLEAAFDGHENPLETVDVEDARFDTEAA